MSTEIAKPTPTLPPPAERIWELIPITRPRASSSGPPELPRLTAASVWIASEIEKSVSASIVRFFADTTPIDSEPCSPNGLPIAATGSPTRTLDVCPSASGTSSSPFGSTLITPTSAFGSYADDLGVDLVAVLELDEHLLALVRRLARAVGDHVRVGRDVAVVVEHEPAALPGAAALEDVLRGSRLRRTAR